MTTIWDGATYEDGDLADGIGNGEIACATKKSTREIYFCTSGDGTTWSTPVLAGTVPDGTSKTCRTHLKRNGSVIVTNGINWTRKSAEYGRAGSWADG